VILGRSARRRQNGKTGKYPGRTINYIMKQDINETFVDCEDFICTYRLQYSIASGGRKSAGGAAPSRRINARVRICSVL
jgi:hypothetical protein